MNELTLPPLPYIDPYFPEPLTANLLQAYATLAVNQAHALQSERHAEELRAYEVTVGNLRAQREQAQPERKPMTDAEIEKARNATFSTGNPYCPVDSKSMRKAARAVEAFHGIKEQS